MKRYRCTSLSLPVAYVFDLRTLNSMKVAVLRALGADIRRTPTEAAFDNPGMY